jgi:hypothetical protein
VQLSLPINSYIYIFCLQPQPIFVSSEKRASELLVRDFDGSLYHQSIGDRHEKMVLSIVVPASAELNFNT